jgi:hypothetical protein
MAAYQSPVLRPRSADSEHDGRLTRRAEHFASAVRFGLGKPDVMRRLHDLTKGLRTVPRLRSLLP